MSKEEFIEGIIKHADHDFEECQRIYEETGNCLWCDGSKKVDANIEGTETVACPVCTVREEVDFTGSTNEDR